jgi:hypothetical protein
MSLSAMLPTSRHPVPCTSMASLRQTIGRVEYACPCEIRRSLRTLRSVRIDHFYILKTKILPAQFSGQHGEGVSISTEMTSFGFGPPSRNVVIRNNVFEHQGTNAILAFTHITWAKVEPANINRMIAITGNTFYNSKSVPISLASLGDVSIVSNTFTSQRSQPIIDFCNM